MNDAVLTEILLGSATGAVALYLAWRLVRRRRS